MKVDVGKVLENQRIDEWKKKVKSDPKNANVWHMYGQVLQGAKRDNEAVEAFKKAVQLKPRDTMSWAALGRLYSFYKK